MHNNNLNTYCRMDQASRRIAIGGVRVKTLSLSVAAATHSLQSLIGAIPVVAGLTFALATPAQAQSEAGRGYRSQSLEEVIVTARRREEAVQTTPLALTAITAEQLTESGVKELRDLTASVPGVNLTASGGGNNTLFSIRGRSKGTIGIAQPSVATYINEVPVSNWGASVPTYDLASVQVLKGPQGTLFGRNSTTGAVLVSTAEPEDEFGGYLSATIGDYRWRQYEGAINLPVIADKLSVRLAVQSARRDGFTENMSFPGNDFDDLHRDNYRASLLLQPVEWLRNLTTYEYNDFDEIPGSVVYQYDPNPARPVNAIPFVNGTLASLPPSAGPCNASPTCDIRVIAERQRAAGARKAWSDVEAFLKGEMTSIINTTTFETEGFTVKNIIGYRTVEFANVSEIDGTEMALLNADTLVANKQLTEEIQIAGSAINDTLDYVAGLFYLESEPDGKNHLLLQQFSVYGTPMTSTSTTQFFTGAIGTADYYQEKSKAAYGQVTLDLGLISDAMSKFSVDAGARYTKDEQSVCTAAFQFLAFPTLSEKECKALTGSSPFYTAQEEEFSKVTWTFGVNYEASDSLFLYAVTRKGYRGGGINTPILGGALLPYQTFEPETVQDIELGLKADFSAGSMLGRLNVALFTSEFDDLQTGISGASDGDSNPANNPSNLTFYANVGTATVSGIEMDLTLAPTDNLKFSLGGAYLEKEIDDFTLSSNSFGLTEAQVTDYAFLGSPRYSYSVGVDYTLPLREMGEVVLSYKYFRISEITYGSVQADGYEESDVRIAWKNLAQTGLDVAAFVNNVFDEDSVAAPAGSTAIGINSVIYNEPRIWGVQVQYKFGG
jgi:iron complex outermembrane receptor protein